MHTMQMSLKKRDVIQRRTTELYYDAGKEAGVVLEKLICISSLTVGHVAITLIAPPWQTSPPPKNPFQIGNNI